MTNNTKQYLVEYKITADATQASAALQQFSSIVNDLTSKNNGIQQFDSQIKALKNSTVALRDSFSNIRPHIDVTTFKSQLGQMQKAIAEFATQTRNIMQAAIGGSNSQFANAKRAMMGNIFDTAALKSLKLDLQNWNNEVSRLEKEYQEKLNHFRSLQDRYIPSTPSKRSKLNASTLSQRMANIKMAGNVAVTEDEYEAANYAKREAYRKWQDALRSKNDINAQIDALNSGASIPKTAYVAKTASAIPNNIQKVIDSIPRFESDLLKEQDEANKKRLELQGQPKVGIKETQEAFENISKYEAAYQEQLEEVNRLRKMAAAGKEPAAVRRLPRLQENEIKEILFHGKSGLYKNTDIAITEGEHGIGSAFSRESPDDVLQRVNRAKQRAIEYGVFKNIEEVEKAIAQYKAYEQYLVDYKNWVRLTGGEEFDQNELNKAEEELARRKSVLDAAKRSSAKAPTVQKYDDTPEARIVRLHQKRLEAAKKIKAQAEALYHTDPTLNNVGGVPLLPPNIAQTIEQAFTGKLTLQPDIAAVKTKIATETFNANLNLVPLISELRTKLNSEKFSINVTPTITKPKATAGKAGGSGVIGALQEEINALKSAAKAPISVGTQLDRSGLLGRAQSGYNTLQTLANRHPITYRLASDGSGGFSLNQALRNLAQVAQRHPVPFRMIHDGSGGFSLNQALLRLAEVAKGRPVPFRMVHDGSGGFALNQAIARLQTIASSRPITVGIQANAGNLTTLINNALKGKNGAAKSYPIDVKPNVGNLSKSIRAALAGTANKPRSFFVDVKARTNGLTSSINAALKGKTFNISAKLDTSTLTSGVPLLEKLQQVWAQLPKTGKRTYTVNLKTTGLGDIAKLERVIALVNSLPSSRNKNYRINTTTTTNNGGAGGGRSVQNTRAYGGGASGGRIYGGRNNDLYTRSRAWAYPFTGNTSFGARTPAAIGMMKGMGMMMGIGEGMSIIGSSFSDAVGYQNTMETAKAILRDNYKGGNFNQDYDDMVKVIRDVAMRTKFTAPEAADAARFMAMAGLDIPMIKQAIAPIADVAAISDMDLGFVADKMTNIMQEYKIAPGDVRKVADMMTKTFTSTNTDMMMLAESLKYVGPMAFSSKQTLSETLAILGTLGNAGIQDSMAGTTMRMMLQNLYNPNKNQKKFMDSIGLKTRNADGSKRSLFDIFNDLSKITDNRKFDAITGQLLSGKDEKSGIDTFDVASKLLRVTSAAGGAALLNDIDKLRGLSTAIQSATGNSEAVSLAKQGTVAGMWAQTKSAFTEAVVKVFEDTDMQKYLKDTLGGLINYLKQPEFIKTIKDLFELIKGIGEVLATFVGWWIKLYQTLPNLVKWVMIGQMFFTQVGYLMTPFVQLIGLITSLKNAILGVTAANTASTWFSTASGTAGSMGATATARSAGGSLAANAAILGTTAAYDAKARQYATRANQYYNIGERIADKNGSTSGWYRAQNGYRLNRGLAAEATLLAWSQRTMGNRYEAFERRRQYRPEMLRDKDFLARAARQGRLSGANLAKGMNNAFLTGLTLNNLGGGLMSSIRGGFARFALGASRFGGYGIAATAIAAMAYGTFKPIIDGFKRDKERAQKEAEFREAVSNIHVSIVNSGEEFKNRYNDVTGILQGITTITVQSATINVEKEQSEVKEKQNKLIADILGSPNMVKHYDPRTGFGKANLEQLYNNIVNDQILKIGGDMLIRPAAFPYLAQKYQTTEHIEAGYRSVDVPTTVYDTNNQKRMLAVAYNVQAALENDILQDYQNQLSELLNGFDAHTQPERLALWDSIQNKINAFNSTLGANFINGQVITKDNYMDAVSNPVLYNAYWFASKNLFNQWVDNNDRLKLVNAIHDIDAGVSLASQEWYNDMINIISTFEISEKNRVGEVVNCK